MSRDGAHGKGDRRGFLQTFRPRAVHRARVLSGLLYVPSPSTCPSSPRSARRRLLITEQVLAFILKVLHRPGAPAMSPPPLPNRSASVGVFVCATEGKKKKEHRGQRYLRCLAVVS